MRVHRQCKRGRATVISERAQHAAEFRIGRATAANLFWHAGRKHTARLEFGEIFCDEAIVGIMNARPLRKAWTELVHQPRPI